MNIDALDYALATKAGRYIILARNMSVIMWSRLFWNPKRKQQRLCKVVFK